MNILENISLAPHTTFGIGGPARFFCAVEKENQLREAVGFAQSKGLPIFVLGGGSNILISDEGFPGLVIQIALKGIEFETAEGLTIASAGEEWDAFVGECVGRGLYGLENLSLIPGTVGAAPIQNIGAYGAEAKDTIEWVEALDIMTGKILKLLNAQCRFAYRTSVFKEKPGRYIVTRVAFRLSKDGVLNTSYKDVQSYFDKHPDVAPTLQSVRDVVIAIRIAKLPDVKEIGTAGSFFKNPILSAEHFKELGAKYTDLPGFPEADGRVKVSLAWILDKVCGVKGLDRENVTTYEKQALVIVAKKGATAKEVNGLADELAQLVKEKTAIEIEREVEQVG